MQVCLNCEAKLIIEDEATARSLLRELLPPHECHPVRTAEEGQE